MGEIGRFVEPAADVITVARETPTVKSNRSRDADKKLIAIRAAGKANDQRGLDRISGRSMESRLPNQENLLVVFAVAHNQDVRNQSIRMAS